MSQNKTVMIPVSGTCPNCGVVNNAQLRTTGPVGTECFGKADGQCGACGKADVPMTGSAVIK